MQIIKLKKRINQMIMMETMILKSRRKLKKILV